MSKNSLWGKKAKFKSPHPVPEPPKAPPPPTPTKPWDKLGPDPLKWLKIGKQK